MIPSALAIQDRVYLPQSPSGLLAYDEPSSPEKRGLKERWQDLFSQGEIHSRTFAFERGNKDHEWSCKICCPRVTEAALRIFLQELATRPGVTWITFSSPAFDDTRVVTTTAACNQLPDLKVIYLEGPFTIGSAAIMESLQNAKAPLEVICIHGYPSRVRGVGEAYQRSRATLPSPATLAEYDEAELLAERLIQETVVPQTEAELTETWRALFEQERIDGTHFYWERLEQDDEAIVACRMSSSTLHPKVLSALIPLLIDRVSTLTLRVDFVDNEKMKLVAYIITHLRGALHLTLTGDFSDIGGEELVQALERSPSVIQGLTVQGSYSWDVIEQLQKVALSRVITKKPQIIIPRGLMNLDNRDRIQRFLDRKAAALK